MRYKIFMVSIAVIVLTAFLLALYTLTLSSNFAEEKNFFLQQDTITTSTISEYKINWVLKEHSPEEKIYGLVDERFLVSNNKKDVYLYDKRHGKAEQIAVCKDYALINPLQLNDQKVLLNYVKVDLPPREFLRNKVKTSDYNYSVPDKTIDTTELIEIYHTQTGGSEKILEFKRMWRLIESIDGVLFENFQDKGASKNGRFVALCMQDKVESFNFYLYDSETKTKKEYRISEDSHRFDVIRNIIVSNDGNCIYFTGSSASDMMITKNLYQLDLLKSELECKLLLKDINSYNISFDAEYILYDYFEDKYNKDSNNLVFLNLVSMKHFEIAHNVLKEGFKVAFSQNKVAYIVIDDTSAKLHVTDFDKEGSSKYLIYDFDVINTDVPVFVKWVNNDKSLLISYGLPSPQNSPLKQTSLVIDLVQ